MLGLGMVIASLFHNAKVAAGFGSFLFFVMQFFAGLWWQRPEHADVAARRLRLHPERCGGAGADRLQRRALAQRDCT